jgi:hypothetical protein
VVAEPPLLAVPPEVVALPAEVEPADADADPEPALSLAPEPLAPCEVAESVAEPNPVAPPPSSAASQLIPRGTSVRGWR